MPRRRTKGNGSVHYNKVKQYWVARLTVPPEISPTGRLERIATTQTAARSLLAQMQRELEEGRLSEGAQQPLAGYLANWLEESARRRLRPRTFRRYEQCVRLQIAPTLGKYRLADLTAQQVQRWVNALIAGGLSPRSTQHAHAVLRCALNQAVRWGVLPHNVATRIDPIRVRRPEVQPLTVEQATTLLELVADHRLAPLYMVAIAMGLRVGEAIGLRWQDIDFERGTLSVKQTIGRVNGRLQIQEPKSERRLKPATEVPEPPDETACA